jgi:predicted small secreted protein
MKKTILSVLALIAVSAAFVVTGCVSTVSGGHALATSWNTDDVTGRYQRTVDQVYGAARTVVTRDGVLLNEYIPHDTTNEVRALYARVSNEKVWIRVEGITPAITQVDVQARTGLGMTDVNLVHELEKEIALQLATNPQ